MSNSDKEDILKYVTPPSTVAIVGVVFFVLSLPGFFITKAITSDNLKAGVVCGVMAVMGIVFICLKYYYLFTANNYIKKAEKDGGTAYIPEDFRKGDRFLNDRIRCGEHYVFGAALGVIVRLSDIKEIKRETKSYRNVPTAENLVLVLRNNKKVTLCSISRVENGTPPFSDIIRTICRYEPDVEVK